MATHYSQAEKWQEQVPELSNDEISNIADAADKLTFYQLERLSIAFKMMSEGKD